MKAYGLILGAMMLAVPAAGQDAAAATDAPDPPTPELLVLEAGQLTLDEFKWVARPVVVFADTPADPAFGEQMELLLSRPAALAERDVVVITDTDPAGRSPIRQALRPRGFSLVLVDKDGRVALRKPTPWHVRELTRAIDKTPLREQELREQRGEGE